MDNGNSSDIELGSIDLLGQKQDDLSSVNLFEAPSRPEQVEAPAQSTSTEEPEATIGNYFTLAGQGIAQSVADVISGAGTGLEVLTQKEDAVSNFLQDLGQTIRESSVKDFDPVSKSVEESFGGKLAKGAGSALTYFTPGGVIKAATQGALQTGESTLREAEQSLGKDLTGIEEAKAFGSGAALGTTEGLLGLGKLFSSVPGLKALDEVAQGGVLKVLLESGKQGVEEAAQEILQQVGGNLIARDIVKYDPDRKIFEGAAEAGELGATLGTTMTALLGLSKRGPKVKEPSIDPKLDKAIDVVFKDAKNEEIVAQVKESPELQAVVLEEAAAKAEEAKPVAKVVLGDKESAPEATRLIDTTKDVTAAKKITKTVQELTPEVHAVEVASGEAETTVAPEKYPERIEAIGNSSVKVSGSKLLFSPVEARELREPKPEELDTYNKIVERFNKNLKEPLEISFDPALEAKSAIEGKNLTLNPNAIKSDRDLIKTLVHQVIGTKGTKEVLGEKWDTFLEGSLKNPSLLSAVVEETRRWHRHVRDKHKGSKRTIEVNGEKYSKEELKELTDEYVAQQATRMLRGDQVKSAWFVRKALTRAKHLTRSLGLGPKADVLTQDDIAEVLSLSHRRLFEDPALKLRPAGTMPVTLVKDQPKELSFDPKEFAENIRVKADDIKQVDILRAEGFGKLQRPPVLARTSVVKQAIESRPLRKLFSPMGTLNNQKEFRALLARTKGTIGQLEKEAKSFEKLFTKADKATKEELFEFLTTKGATAESYNFTPEQRATADKVKAYINEFSRFLKENRLLSAAVADENFDSYLPRIYLQYLDNKRTPRGKLTSFMDYLQKRKDLTEEQRQALGQIKDPAFLVSQTFATTGRDVALINFYNNIAGAGLNWVIKRKVTVGNTEMTYKEALEAVEEKKKLLKSSEFLSASGQQKLMEEIERLESAIARSELVIPKDKLEADYVLIGTDKRRFGALAGAYVRKEIVEELREIANVFEDSNTGKLAKWLSPESPLATITSFWKLAKVAGNPPSIVRNMIGTWMLMDIATPTNSIKMTDKLFEEVTNTASKNKSKYWKWAEKYGIFTGTFAANEIEASIKKYKLKLKQAEYKDKKASALFKALPHAQEKLIVLAEALGHSFTLVEGAFKVTLMRDHIERWEKREKVSIDSLTPSEREAVILEAIDFANEAVFDYSAVPGWIKVLRRVPLGAPFITFSYKVVPQLGRSIQRNPQKFVKYVALPYLLSTLLRDLEEEDAEEIKKKLPDYVRNKAEIAILPYRTKDGNLVYFDYSYFTPWGSLVNGALEAYAEIKEQDADALESAYIAGKSVFDIYGFLGGPVPTILSGLKTNRDYFTGREIVTGDTSSEQLTEILDWLWTQAMPPFLTSRGAAGKFYKAFREEVDSFGLPKSTYSRAALSLAGVNLNEYDPTRAKVFARSSLKKELRNLDLKIFKIRVNKNLSELEKLSKIKALKSKQKRLRERYYDRFSK